MSTSRIVVVAADDDPRALMFPVIGATDILDHGFDFGPWVRLAPDDRIAGVAIGLLPDTAALGAAAQTGNVVVVRVGPGPPGNYALVCSVVTAQARRKTAVAYLVILPSDQSESACRLSTFRR